MGMTDMCFKDLESKHGQVRRSDARRVLRRFAPGARRRRCSTACTSKPTAQPAPLKQVAGVRAPDARTLVITAYDKSVVGEIRKAIEKSDLGITPNVDGNRRFA